MIAPGTFVRVLAHRIPGHCRTPTYLKGHVGEVVALAGTYRDPEQLAYHRPGLPPRRLYRVRFRQRELWSDYGGPAVDTLDADLYEHWVEAVETATTEGGR
ncbi:MAG: SH3-like domain-containing protein [Burkholderiales bacterium]|nr:nitrile hydratase subunit beta [Burkholderiales bacterium]